MNSNWNTLVTPVNGYDNSRNVYNDETFIHGFPLRMPDEGYDTDRDVYNAETFGHITKRKKPASFDAPPGFDANKRHCTRRPPLHPSAYEQESRIRSIVRDEIYQAARAAVGAVRPVTLAVPMDTNSSYLTPRAKPAVAPWIQREPTWAPTKVIPLVRQTNEYVPPNYGPQTYEQYVNSLIYNFDALQDDN